jgi:ribonuclease HI
VAWTRHWFKGNKVYAETDESGELVVEGGRVRIRYRPDDDRTYDAAARNLSPIDQPPDEADAPGSAAQRGSRTTRGTGATRGPKARPGATAHFVESEDEELELLASTPDGRDAVIVYTDGACRGNPGPAALGAVLLCGDRRRELSEYLGRGTNNIAELTAVLRALQTLKDRHRRIVVHTDSTYVKGILSQGWKAKANRELIAELRELVGTFEDIHFVKVPAHSGVPENERADELANLAIDRDGPKRG